MSHEPVAGAARVPAALRPRRLPISTYRLQLHGGFGFDAARRIVPYLARLGVTDVYTSPYFTARPGSTHGYDVCDHNKLSPELGGEEAYAPFVAALAAHGMGHVVDFVPNHMSIDTSTNSWWHDVLENGPSSPAGRFFDIEWAPLKTALEHKVLLPILGDQYGNVLERGELTLAFEEGRLMLTYGDRRLPINPRQATRVYRLGLDELQAELGDEDPHLREFLSILSALQNMPAASETDPEKIKERSREKEVARERLVRLVAAAPRIARYLDEAVRSVNGEPGRPETFDRLHELLEAQAYRLAYWRTASHEINYRRFFDVNDLAGLRVEDPEVFDQTHRLLARLIAEGGVTAVRVDHPDGLFDPARYFRMLQELDARAGGLDPAPRPLYVLAEKILSAGEALPADWAVHGTTGYNFLNDLNGLFVDRSNARRLRRTYAKLAGRDEPFDEVVYESKKLIMETALASELNVLAHLLDRISDGNRRSRDFTLNSLRDAIAEIVACFPVYRTYVDDAGWTLADRESAERAVARARRRNPAVEASIFDFVREILLPRPVETEPLPAGWERREGYPSRDEAERGERVRFARKFQQYTGPVQAKGLEDTAFYRYNALLSLNEVGGDPSVVGRSAADFHAAAARRLADWPFEMIATSTHDTKLGEDVRARVNVMSELPEDWRRDVARWMRINRGHRRVVEGEPAPDRNDEYRFYQALVGIWPPDAFDVPVPPAADLVARMREYMTKATKEAKVHTSWINENQAYDEAVVHFVERALAGPSAERFAAALVPIARRLARAGMVNSLAQVVLKTCSPGVPDVYQGADLWELSLVDPDNRRPVDFTHRERTLDALEPLLAAPEAAAVAALVDAWPDGRIKLFVTAQALRLRKSRPDLFLEGDYVPLALDVTVPGDAIAFSRVRGDQAVLVLAPRLVAKLETPDRWLPVGMECWKTSRALLPPALAGRRFRNVLTGEELKPTSSGAEAWLFLGQVFQSCPVAMLIAD
jgi:(1->4)-alpha-D-glucan 1-alpha-D-glucosylmutase